ncbi:hypothetical protein Cpar_0789 [Chlorobaculum parvum NCIB 8327]|uniref:Uncharacterized protein n=1 Tax=Chlorobaculum parvum (strain DSM 263 / NCIMB 8327) TaxID=517417 RepID=B3QMQ2_CHLP8|nr:hypothetical protein [Chlorobaculum parvum]ACF11205.1 hypothetical protein Cpar_0789 [Chlorobaculum parvum NCIB 8327]
MSDIIKVRVEQQINEIADEVSAIIAVVRPILYGLLHALKREVVEEVNGYANVKLFMLPRLYRPGDGDCGICFEYAVHDAIRRGDAPILEKVNDSMRKYCRVPGNQTSSILFGAEKSGAIQLLETAENLLTDESRLLTGAQAQPIKLRRYINMLAAAFRKPTTRPSLPYSISGLWKADLFLGMSDSDRWVGTTVKINPRHLEGAKGLRIAIIPSQQGRDDRIRLDFQKNLVVCPLPYDGAFMELFYVAWGIVQQFLAADARVPREVNLPMASHRMVARLLEDRREYPLIEIIESLQPLAQPELLNSYEQQPQIDLFGDVSPNVNTVIAPVSREV